MLLSVKIMQQKSLGLLSANVLTNITAIPFRRRDFLWDFFEISICLPAIFQWIAIPRDDAIVIECTDTHFARATINLRALYGESSCDFSGKSLSLRHRWEMKTTTTNEVNDDDDDVNGKYF